MALKGALAGALGMKPSAEGDEPAGTDQDDEPNDLELAAAEELQQAVKSGTPADVVKAFRGLKSACEADYGGDE